MDFHASLEKVKRTKLLIWSKVTIALKRSERSVRMNENHSQKYDSHMRNVNVAYSAEPMTNHGFWIIGTEIDVDRCRRTTIRLLSIQRKSLGNTIVFTVLCEHERSRHAGRQWIFQIPIAAFVDRVS